MSINDLLSNYKLSSSFYFLNKNELNNFTEEMEKVKSNINFTNFHPDRRIEFLLGRVCANRAIKNKFGLDYYEIGSAADRSPIWPEDFVGSITHNSECIGAMVASKKDLRSVGIDIETRKRVKERITDYIINTNDLKNHKSLDTEDLNTIIFSAKESLFKLLYPLVGKFFGFEYAAVDLVDLENSKFRIKLLKELSSEFRPGGLEEFYGTLILTNNFCLTILELPKT